MFKLTEQNKKAELQSNAIDKKLKEPKGRNVEGGLTQFNILETQQRDSVPAEIVDQREKLNRSDIARYYRTALGAQNRGGTAKRRLLCFVLPGTSQRKRKTSRLLN